jgi:hypothetical protein
LREIEVLAGEEGRVRGISEMKEKRMILGGTARSPQDVEVLHQLGLGFAEIPILDPSGFSGQSRILEYVGLCR